MESVDLRQFQAFMLIKRRLVQLVIVEFSNPILDAAIIKVKHTNAKIIRMNFRDIILIKFSI